MSGIEQTKPGSLDSATQQRLEQIIERVQSLKVKMDFYAWLGDQERAEQYQQAIRDQWRQSIINQLEGIAAQRDQINPGRVSLLLMEVERERVTHPAIEFVARQCYEQYIQEENFSKALEIARKHLHLPEEVLQPLREKNF